MAKHRSLDMASRTGSASDSDGRWVPVAGRTGSNYQWTITNDVGYVDSGGSVTVRVEASPRRSSDDAVTVATFTARTAPINESTTVTLSGYLARGYIRTVANVTGTVTVGTEEEASLFNITAESGRLPRQMEKWSELEEAGRRAERDLLTPYENSYGYSLAMHHPAFADDFKEAMERQLRHVYQVWALSKDQDAARSLDAAPVDRRARFIVSKYAPATFF